VTITTNSRRISGGAKYDLWVAMYRAVRAVTERVDTELSASGHIPLADYEVLHRIYTADNERIRLLDLARSVLVSPSSATRIVDRLEKRGLAVRQPSDVDRRETFVTLTTAGQSLYLSVRPKLLEAVERHFSSLVPDHLVADLLTTFQGLSAGDADRQGAENAMPAIPANGSR
jgi:DNA-binding MarR family transcriptional regulator